MTIATTAIVFYPLFSAFIKKSAGEKRTFQRGRGWCRPTPPTLRVWIYSEIRMHVNITQNALKHTKGVFKFYMERLRCAY